MEKPEHFDLVKPEEAAELLRTTKKTLANQRSAGEGLPYIKMNGRVLYSRAALFAEIKRNTVTPGAA